MFYRSPQSVLSQFEDESFLVLVFKYLDQSIGAGEYADLQRRLKEDSRCRDAFVASLIHLQQIKETAKEITYGDVLPDAVSDVQSSAAARQDALDDEAFDYTLALKFLAQDEETASAVEVPREKPAFKVQKLRPVPRYKREITRSQIFTLTSAAAMLLFALFLKFAPSKPRSVDVGTVVDQMNAQWAQPGFHLEKGDRLWTKEAPLELNKGIVKIRYDDGVDVLVEGPAIFEIERSGLFLEYGRLYSHVSESGAGFTVKTPTSQFVDMGTEFGVQADVNGSSELHVIRGKVQFFAAVNGGSRAGRMVTENNSVRYDVNRDRIDEIAVQKTAFVRQIQSETGVVWRGQTTLDLADIVGGGDGLGAGRIGRAIDPWTGAIKDWTMPPRDTKRPGRYTLVSGSPFIDGVFIPDGGKEPIQVSSGGDQWNGPDTSGFFKNPVCSSMYIPKGFDPTQHKDVIGTFTQLEEAQLMAVPKDLIGLVGEKNPPGPRDTNLLMHANLGITFDLEAIGGVVPGKRPGRFTSTFGLANIARVERGDLDMWVLVDGQVRSTRRVSQKTDSVRLDIPLAQTDRFLTLVVSEGERRADDPPQTSNATGDWGLFMNPTIEFE